MRINETPEWKCLNERLTIRGARPVGNYTPEGAAFAQNDMHKEVDALLCQMLPPVPIVPLPRLYPCAVRFHEYGTRHCAIHYSGGVPHHLTDVEATALWTPETTGKTDGNGNYLVFAGDFSYLVQKEDVYLELPTGTRVRGIFPYPGGAFEAEGKVLNGYVVQVDSSLAQVFVASFIEVL